LLVSGKHGVLAGLIGGEVAGNPLAKVAAKRKGYSTAVGDERGYARSAGRMAKYNQWFRVEEELGRAAWFSGRRAFAARSI
jgi:enolase